MVVAESYLVPNNAPRGGARHCTSGSPSPGRDGRTQMGPNRERMHVLIKKSGAMQPARGHAGFHKKRGQVHRSTGERRGVRGVPPAPPPPPGGTALCRPLRESVPGAAAATPPGGRESFSLSLTGPRAGPRLHGLPTRFKGHPNGGCRHGVSGITGRQISSQLHPGHSPPKRQHTKQSVGSGSGRGNGFSLA